MKLFLSGCEGIPFGYIARDCGTESLLFSNYHRGDIDLKEYEGKNLMMDSGLFTMMFGAWKGKTYTKDDLHDYTDKYISDMIEMKWPGVIVEMDVHKVLGTQYLPEFRKKFEERWGIERTVFVWHVEEEVEGLKRLAKRYPFIALSIPELRIVFKKNVEKVTVDLLKLIHKTNPKCKVHLLGCTQKKLMENPYYFSCDSSSWLSSVRYGWLQLFHSDGKIKKRDVDNRTIDLSKIASDTLGKKYVKRGNNPRQIQYFANLAITADSYRKLESDINRKFYPYDNRPLVWPRSPQK